MGKHAWSIFCFVAGFFLATVRDQLASLQSLGSSAELTESAATAIILGQSDYSKGGSRGISSVVGASSRFDEAVKISWDEVLAGPVSPSNGTFDVAKFDQKEHGGLHDSDRVKLAEIYGAANSVFEFGLGESTIIAGKVGVRRYAGVDNDATWVAMARDGAPSHFRFYFADTGPTRNWGYPLEVLAKQVYNYQSRPLLGEPLPFDVYLVDGRYRMSCIILSFLHASARAADPTATKVLLHDCRVDNNGKFQFRWPRLSYYNITKLFDLVDHSGYKLCVLKRKLGSSDADLLEMWREFHTINN